jgi:hypothetical protein
VDPGNYTVDAETGSTHALISVERTTSASLVGTPRAGALAGFVRIPPGVDAADVMRLVGLGLELPAAGQCASRERSRQNSPALSPMGRLEFLEAGNVTLATAWATTTLAPRAFPTVTDDISGVVYTTRDRAAEPLPADVVYDIRTTGGLNVPPLALRVGAPPSPDGVTVSGAPLSELTVVSISEPIDLTWSVGGPVDIVYAELSSSDGAPSAVCSFRDDAGAGTIPAFSFSGVGEGRITLHRVRALHFEQSAIDHGELRFDFDLSADVTFE